MTSNISCVSFVSSKLFFFFDDESIFSILNSSLILLSVVGLVFYCCITHFVTATKSKQRQREELSSTTTTRSTIWDRNLIGQTKANGRPLSAADSVYFDNKHDPIGFYGSFSPDPFPKNEQKIMAAFQQAILTSPLLQTRVEGNGSSAKYVQMDPKHPDWPVLKILSLSSSELSDIDNNDDCSLSATAKAKLIVQTELHNLCEGSQDAHRTSLRATMIRGNGSVGFAFASPHHFLDGIAYAAFYAKFYLYMKLPTFLWCLVDLLSYNKNVPTFMEMAFKKDFSPELLEKLQKCFDVNSSKKFDPKNFCFPKDDNNNNNNLKPIELNGIYNETIAVVSNDQVKKCCLELRQRSDVTLSTAFGGLLLKTLAKIIETNKDLQEQVKQRPNLVMLTPINGRKLGKWGDWRDRILQFPVIANYAFPAVTQVTYTKAQQGTIEDLGLIIKSDINNVRTNIDNRLQQIQAKVCGKQPTSGMVCCVTSVVLPKKTYQLFGAAESIAFSPVWDHQSVPRVVFMIITNGDKTTVSADIRLPIPGLTKQIILNAIHEAAKDSPLEQLLSA